MTVILIHRLLQSALLPPLNSLLIIVLGAYFFKLHRTRGQVLVVIGLLSLYLQATPYVAYRLNLLIAPQPMKLTALTTAQAVVVLGGGINDNANEYDVQAISSADTFTRVRYTAYLAKKAPQLPIFASGGRVNSNDSEASLIKRALIDEFGVKNRIYLEPDSKTTRENALFTARLLQQYGISQVVLVTAASHMRRARALFEQSGVKVIAAPTAYFGLGYQTQPLLWWVPTARALNTTASVLHELIGYWYDVAL